MRSRVFEELSVSNKWTIIDLHFASSLENSAIKAFALILHRVSIWRLFISGAARLLIRRIGGGGVAVGSRVCRFIKCR